MNWKKIEVWLLILISSVIFILACIPADAKVEPNYSIPEDVYIDLITCSGEHYILATTYRKIHFNRAFLWTEAEKNIAKTGSMIYEIRDSECDVGISEKR